MSNQEAMETQAEKPMPVVGRKSSKEIAPQVGVRIERKGRGAGVIYFVGPSDFRADWDDGRRDCADEGWYLNGYGCGWDRGEFTILDQPAAKAEAPAVAKWRVGDRVVLTGTIERVDVRDNTLSVKPDDGAGHSWWIDEDAVRPEASQPALIGDSLGEKLWRILARHCGQRGQTEGAVETLKRIIAERDESAFVKAELEKLRMIGDARHKDVERNASMRLGDLRANLDLASSRLADASNELAAKERELTRLRAERDEWRNKYRRRGGL